MIGQHRIAIGPHRVHPHIQRRPVQQRRHLPFRIIAKPLDQHTLQPGWGQARRRSWFTMHQCRRRMAGRAKQRQQLGIMGAGMADHRGAARNRALTQ